ncbi:hypothetical protein JD844_016453 [Phrynosoma platyrhinos]|uniref:Uncharacterized protein n=1 Tax=Phrynosoma platyrhinos TaxID=52577 RepID=A0ABQ7SKI1_PHRPL|nr:hypothetical protein JD844_016453 [Phrynosoma platyrhinos]
MTKRQVTELNQENQLLLKRLRHARLKNKELEFNLAKIQEELKEQKKVLPACVAQRNVSIQTENRLYQKGDGIHHKEQELIKENASDWNPGKVNDLEHQLHLANQKVKELENKKMPPKEKTVPLQRKISPHKCMCKKKGSCSCKYLDQLLFEIQRLKMENETISKERRMLRNELVALDKDFFDEIEDLKYALQEAIKLNTQYEKCLKQVSSSYGITLTSTLTAGNRRIGL